MIEYTNWEPGDPLYPRHAHSNYFFNWRDDTLSQGCACSDAASWPEPFHRHDLDNEKRNDLLEFQWQHRLEAVGEVVRDAVEA